MFKKAERKNVPLKLAITGCAGSGKTMGALRLARGLVGDKGKVAFLDTENESASLYDDVTDFDVCNIKDKNDYLEYLKIIKAAAKDYDVLIIDSFSHVWEAILDYKSKLDSRGGNSFTSWNEAGTKFNSILNEILYSKINIICCLRAKTEYVLETNSKGKQEPRKVGMGVKMRDGIEFEFTVVFDLDQSHQATTSKDRTRLFDGKFTEITEQTGRDIDAWRKDAKPLEQEAPKTVEPQKVLTEKDEIDPLPMDFPNDLKEVFEPNEEKINAFCIEINYIKRGQTWRDLHSTKIIEIKEKLGSFLKAAGVKEEIK